MLAFQKYQIAFTAHIRNPKNNPKPAKVNNARMAVYREIVFNNIVGSISSCFPVCQQMLGKRAWRQLCRAFFASSQSSSPLFRDIPKAFLDFIPTQDVPAYIPALAHYEWAELAVSALPSSQQPLSKHVNLLVETPIIAPHLLLSYEYAVHSISKSNKHINKQQTYLLVFRNSAYQIRFIALNAMTHQLLHLIASEKLTGENALLQIATILQHPDAKKIVQFGLPILEDLMQQGAILGSVKTNTKG